MNDDRLSLREAVEVCGEFGNLYADFNESKVLFRPESSLFASRDTIKLAFKTSLLGDRNMSEAHRNAHDLVYPQIALFVPDSDSIRATAFSRQPYKEVIGQRAIAAVNPVAIADMYFGAQYTMGHEQFLKTLHWIGDEFYNSEYFEGRDSADASFMRSLAVRCWTDMWVLVKDWREFVNEHQL